MPSNAGIAKDRTMRLKRALAIVGTALLVSLSPALGEEAPLSPVAIALVQHVFEGLDPDAPVVDCHVHIIGTSQGGHGCEVNPAMLSPWHPFKRFGATLYLHASGANDMDRFDDEYVDRLLQLARGFGRPVKLHILALDHHYNPDGTINRQRTEFFVPNDYVVRLAEQHPDLFVPVVSIHPYRPDAVVELERWAAKGVREVKWLPNAQGIDPADPRCDAFYKRMHELDVVLLTHAGEEKAVSAKGAQALGNPLKLRRALDAGVTVIVAHCASLGRNADLDHPGRTATNFDLFLRLMGEERYQGRLFGDISAITQVNRMPKPLMEILQRPDLQERLMNGSDYPLPGIDLVIWTRELVSRRLITHRERKALNEIFHANPLLFDFVLKRSLREPGTGQGLSSKVFLGGKAYPGGPGK